MSAFYHSFRRQRFGERFREFGRRCAPYRPGTARRRGRVGGLVVEPPRELLELVGLVWKLGDTAIVDQTQAPLDSSQDSRRLRAVRDGFPRSKIPWRRRPERAAQKLGRKRSGWFCTVDEQEILHEELEISESAGAALEVVAGSRGLEPTAHRQDFRRQERAIDRPGRELADGLALTSWPKPPVAKITRARVSVMRSHTCEELHEMFAEGRSRSGQVRPRRRAGRSRVSTE